MNAQNTALLGTMVPSYGTTLTIISSGQWSQATELKQLGTMVPSYNKVPSYNIARDMGPKLPSSFRYSKVRNLE
jgi:hypothetical protein